MFIQCSGCSVPLQRSVSLQKPQHPSCQGCAGTHFRNFQGKSDLILQSHLGSGTSNLSLQFFLFLNCRFALVSLPCHCLLRSGWMVWLSIILTSHITLPMHLICSIAWVSTFEGWVFGLFFFFVGEEWRSPYTAEKTISPSILTDGWTYSWLFCLFLNNNIQIF